MKRRRQWSETENCKSTLCEVNIDSNNVCESDGWCLEVWELKLATNETCFGKQHPRRSNTKSTLLSTAVICKVCSICLAARLTFMCGIPYQT